MDPIIEESKAVVAATVAPARNGAAFKRFKDRTFTLAAAISGLAILIIVIAIGLKIGHEGALAGKTFGWKFLTGMVWDVPREQYGALPYIFGSLASSLIAIAIAVPISVGAAILLSEIVDRRLARPIRYFMELLAAIPSVVYGMWGFLVLCPFLLNVVEPWMVKNLGFLPIFAGPPFLTSMFAAGVVLAIMIAPFIISVITEMFQSLPKGLREASYALGSNRWETIRNVVLPSSSGGIIAAVMLGLGRAIGETMAVVWVIGNTPQIKASILQSGYSMPALLANQFAEAFTDPLQRSSLMAIAFLLFVSTIVINAFARTLATMATAKINAVGNATKLRSLSYAVLRFLGFSSVVLILAALAFEILKQLLADVEKTGFRFIFHTPALVVLAIVAAIVLRRIEWSAAAFNRLRKVRQGIFVSLSIACGLVACAVLAIILAYIAYRGSSGFSIHLFTELPRPPGVPGGGLKNAIVGTVLLVGVAALVGVPLGVLGGVYLAEFKGTKLTNAVRFAADILGGVPSIVVGLFAYSVLVLPFSHFSALSGSLGLAIIMIPIVMRITEEILRLVPANLREGSLGLGASRAETILKVVLPAARSGLVTGIMLAVARVSGETAPLVFTAFGNDLLNWNSQRPLSILTEPTSSLTLSIYKYAAAPYDDWVTLAWNGALILVCLVLVVNVAARMSANRIGRRLGTTT